MLEAGQTEMPLDLKARLHAVWLLKSLKETMQEQSVPQRVPVDWRWMHKQVNDDNEKKMENNVFMFSMHNAVRFLLKCL